MRISYASFFAQKRYTLSRAQLPKVICDEVIEASVSCDVISSLLPGLTPRAFLCQGSREGRCWGAAFSVRDDEPGAQRSGRRETAKWGGRKPRSRQPPGGGAVKSWTTSQGRTRTRSARSLMGAKPALPNPQGAGKGLSKDDPPRGHGEPLADRWGVGRRWRPAAGWAT